MFLKWSFKGQEEENPNLVKIWNEKVKNVEPLGAHFTKKLMNMLEVYKR